MIILAFDCATTTGWATNRDGVQSGTQKFELRRGSSPGMRFLEFNKWVERMICLTNPSLLAFEQAHHRGGAATEVCVGFTTRIIEAAARHDIEHIAVHDKTIKKFATGNGNCGKPAMQNAASVRYPHYQPHQDEGADEADALCLLSYCISEFNI